MDIPEVDVDTAAQLHHLLGLVNHLAFALEHLDQLSPAPIELEDTFELL